MFEGVEGVRNYVVDKWAVTDTCSKLAIYLSILIYNSYWIGSRLDGWANIRGMGR